MILFTCCSLSLIMIVTITVESNPGQGLMHNSNFSQPDLIEFIWTVNWP